MKPKAYLRSIGVDIPENQRGRMSAANKALIEKAVREGIAIDGYAVSKVEPKTEAEKVTPKVEKVAIGNEVVDIPDQTRPESSWEAYASVNGKIQPIGMRSVCNTCGSSLTYCPCRTPLVTVDHDTRVMVNFKPRTSPLPTKMW